MKPPDTKITFSSFSFGCRVNQAEMEELNKQLYAAGFRYSEENPSLYIINTCAVTAKAEREARQFINQVRKKYPKAKIIITGCAATKWLLEKKILDERLLIVDNKSKDSIIGILRSKAKFSSKILPAGKTSNKYLPSGRLLLKIQDGCQRFCTYCIVPYLRGKPKSVPIAKIADMINAFQIKEVILTAVNTEAYGLDTDESFIDLIKAIINKTKVPRISFGSINPWSINYDFFKFYKEVLPQKRLVDFFHIPLQSGSNKILKLMTRDYTKEEFLEKINALIKINPFAFIGTDVIVGFLDEEDKDFEETYNFLADSPISKFHIFRFSNREGTAAYYLSKQLKEPQEQTKIKRAKILADLGRKKYEKFLARNIGRGSSALFLWKGIDDFQEALLDNQIPIWIKTDKNFIGEIKMVKVEMLREYRLFGKLL